MSQKIFEIKEIDLQILEIAPPQLLITVQGLASTSGWTNPRLELADTDPNDGIYEYEFVADPPTDIVLQMLTKISASLTLNEIPGDFKGVRISASKNSMEALEAQEVNDPIQQPVRIVEPLLGATWLTDKLVLRVRSNGCTSKKNFRAVVNTGFTGMSPVFVTIYRIREDRCRASIPNGVEIAFALDELGLEPGQRLWIANPIGDNRTIDEFRLPENFPALPMRPLPSPPWPWPVPDPEPWPPHPWHPLDPRNPWGPFGPRPGNPFGNGFSMR